MENWKILLPPSDTTEIKNLFRYLITVSSTKTRLEAFKVCRHTTDHFQYGCLSQSMNDQITII